MIEQKLWGVLLGYNLLRYQMVEMSRHCPGIHPCELSFTELLDSRRKGHNRAEEVISSQHHASIGEDIAIIMNHPRQDQSVSNIMTEAQRWTVKCQDPADGSGDVIIDLPPDLLASLGLSISDVLTIEVIDGAIVLTPKSSDSATP